MLRYKKRNRPDNADTEKKSTALEETELVLRLKKEELFDQHVLLPHAELNEIVYSSVNNFVEKYLGTDLTLSIFSEPVNPVVQNTFREAYRAHYEDEDRKVTRYLKRRYLRGLVLLVFSLTAFIVSDRLGRSIPGYNVLLNVIANVGAFCLWEIGYTHFANRDALDEKKRIRRALNAKIEFN